MKQKFKKEFPQESADRHSLKKEHLAKPSKWLDGAFQRFESGR